MTPEHSGANAEGIQSETIKTHFAEKRALMEDKVRDQRAL